MRTLIADDDRTYYGGLESLVASELPEDTLAFAADGIAALSELKRAEAEGRPYDLLILDEVMTESAAAYGSALLQKLSENALRTPPAIIYITGHYNEIPAAQIAGLGTLITLFLDKSADADALFRAVSLIRRQRSGGMGFQPSELFGDAFMSLVLEEVARILRQPHRGYYGQDPLAQQQRMGALIRSFLTTLQLRERWEADDVLEQSVFLVEGLCRIFSLPDALVELVRRFLNIEEVLYTIPRYRDHFFHQIKVFLLGFCIINALNRDRRLEGTCLSDENGMKLWFLASAFHDVGYPFEKMTAWLTRFIDGVLRTPDDRGGADAVIPLGLHWGALFGHGYHWHHLQRTAQYISDRYCPAPPDRCPRISAALAQHVAGRPDHGLYSCLILQNFLRLNLDDAQVEPVAAAVALHNTEVCELVRQRAGTPLSFDRDPLSFLLAYCDLAQDWGRVHLLSRGPRFSGGLAYQEFDNPGGDAGRCTYDPATREVRVDLRYGRRLTVPEIDQWQQDVFQRQLQPCRNVWAAGQVGFTITYYHGEDHQSRQRLDAVSF
jgi:DNA-binding NarL/FixJ family response regulator